jgi:hypothetical protein
MHISRANDKLKSGHQLVELVCRAWGKQVRDVCPETNSPFGSALVLALLILWAFSSKLLSVLKLAQGFLTSFHQPGCWKVSMVRQTSLETEDDIRTDLVTHGR